VTIQAPPIDATEPQARTRRLPLPRRLAAMLRRQALPIATLLAFALLWEIGGRAMDFLYLPPLSQVLTALGDLMTSLRTARSRASSPRACSRLESG
jgi:hypothetical protein